MPNNMSNRGRALRAFLVAPAAVIVGALLGPASILALVLYLFAGVMVTTAAAGFCPLYALSPINSLGRRSLPH